MSQASNSKNTQLAEILLNSGKLKNDIAKLCLNQG
jgi:hypothetical protein